MKPYERVQIIHIRWEYLISYECEKITSTKTTTRRIWFVGNIRFLWLFVYCCEWIVVNELLGMILSSCIWFLFFSYPINLLSSSSEEGCKRIKEGKKETMILFNSKLYFGVYDYSVARIFSGTNRSSHVSQTRYWNILESFFGGLWWVHGSNNE